MFTHANCASKCNANSYRYSYAYDCPHCYADSDPYGYRHTECYGYCYGNSYSYGHGQTNAYCTAERNSEDASYTSASPGAAINLVGRDRWARRSEACAVSRHDNVKALTLFCASA